MDGMDVVFTAIVAFTLAGFVKGVLGFGFPVISLIILTLTIGLYDALALVVVPTLFTNIWQGVDGPYLKEIVARFGLYFIAAAAGIIASSFFLTSIDVNLLSGLLGSTLFAYGASRIAGVKLDVPPQRESILAVTLGLINGILTGLTGSFMVPPLCCIWRRSESQKR